MSSTWPADGTPPGNDQPGFYRGSGPFSRGLPGFKALNWIDRDWVIRITVPPEGNEQALNKDLHFHPDPGVVPCDHPGRRNRANHQDHRSSICSREKRGLLPTASFAILRVNPRGLSTGCFWCRPWWTAAWRRRTSTSGSATACTRRTGGRFTVTRRAEEHHTGRYQAEVRVRVVDKPVDPGHRAVTDDAGRKPDHGG